MREIKPDEKDLDSMTLPEDTKQLLETTAATINTLRIERQEKWLESCMKKILPAKIFEHVRSDPKRVTRWLSKNGVHMADLPDGTKKLMQGANIISILPPIDAAFNQ